MPYTALTLIARRSLLAAFGAMWLCIGTLPARADAADGMMKLPTSIAYMRFSQTGAETLSPKERQDWEAMSMRLGPMIERMEPFEYSRILPMPAPMNDGGAAAALNARNMATRAGYDYVLLYALIYPEPIVETADPYSSVVPEEAGREDTSEAQAVMPGRAAKKRVKWLFSRVAQRVAPEAGDTPLPAIYGEAHLIDAAQGGVLISVWTSAPQNTSLGIFREKHDAEAVILEDLIATMERRIQLLARDVYVRGASLAD
ncbi:MAG: hypothetical protein CME88_13965 [Hirschia sp.]|mgnify:CR=1 FL=1|nr:hypothetical protein [Hirschia sp.]MBF19478.1 hypothetical protein [Hirschia sp.]|tara:strand:+ start:272 stop:1045 length:774 start_codon:yes stop_codon:yes gene_type:complete